MGQETRVYACGPKPMLKSITAICRKKELMCEVSLEETMACGVGVCLGCAVKVKGQGTRDKGQGCELVCKDGPVFDAKDLIWK